MNHRATEIELQLGLGEDSNWEFKQVEFAGNLPTRPTRTDWADEIAAFANTIGGTLVAGVADDGTVIGLSHAQLAHLDAHLKEICSDTIKPQVRIRTHRVQLSNGRNVLLAEIPEGGHVHDSPGGSYVRVGASRHRMADDERFRLAQRRSQARNLRFDARPMPNSGFRTLSEALWKPLLSAEDATEPEAALRKQALLLLDEFGVLRASVAGILLCTHEPEQWLPNATITATRYLGRDQASRQVEAEEITGPLNTQIARAVDFAVRNMQVVARKDPARSNMPQYSDKALFEALVNAVAHRDYSVRGGGIRLSMFDDRLEIRSPGSLPNNLTADSMACRQSVRNEILASALSRMPVRGTHGSEDRVYFMERRGDGVPIIRRETCRLCGTLPQFQVIDDSELLLTIPAAILALSPAKVLVSVRSGAQPLPRAEVLCLFPNETRIEARTDAEGKAEINLYTTQLPMTVFVAASNHAAHLERNWVPSERALSINLKMLSEGGSVICSEATGELPGMQGSINPARDLFDRTYMYATNIAINGGEQQPVHFVPGEKLHLTDAVGTERCVRILDILGRSALVEHFHPRQSEA